MATRSSRRLGPRSAIGESEFSGPFFCVEGETLSPEVAKFRRRCTPEELTQIGIKAEGMTPDELMDRLHRAVSASGEEEVDTTTTISALPVTSTSATTRTAPSDLLLNNPYFVDVDLEREAFELAGVWVLVSGDPARWQPPGESYEGGAFILDTLTTGTFRGNLAESKV